MHIVHTDCIHALGSIGNEKVVKGIVKYFTKNKKNRNGLAEILGKIPYDYSEAAALGLLEKEKNKTTKAFLACSLCDIFSIKAKDALTKLIKKGDYDMEIDYLPDRLVSILEYHKIEQFDNILQFPENEQSGYYDTTEHTQEHTTKEKKKIITKFKKKLSRKKKKRK